MSMTICQNEHCRGGIGPHMTDECPWLLGGQLSVNSILARKQRKQLERIKSARLELQAALNDHTHVAIMKHSGAECAICDKMFGWFCTKSPDNTCHYHSEEGPQLYDEKPYNYVSLITGEEHVLPADYDGTYETEDECIFCGQPQERC